ncbi:MAG: protein kinase domain-containing protein [Chthoniobacteraceae bacterium]
MPETVTFDHYEVLTRDDGALYELGRGAMGITYKAFDTNLRVPVALKVINCNNLNTDVARQRFVREARSAAKLRHRHVASVFHLGAEGDTYFYAMEFIDGETVEALIKRQGSVAPLLALRIALQVTRALNAATQCNLVHRDIKPSNLMLVREDDELVVKVIDFGLAKLCVPGEGDEEAATLSMGGFVGTPHFASPEQLEDGDIDVRSDIYSLGVTLWYMLAGNTPFAGSIAQVMSQHLTKPPPFERLSNVPPEVSALLRKMLAKDPALRYQTPTELRIDLEKCIESVAGAPASVATVMAADDENYATIADESAFTVTATQFEIGEVVAGRYEIRQSLGETNAGRVFRAFDRELKSDVRLLVLLREYTDDTTLYTQLEREVNRIVPVQHANLLRVHGLETVMPFSFVVIEWTEGFSLLELLRARRELSVAETLVLLKQAAAGLDHAIAAGLKRLDLALHQVFVDFGTDTNAKENWLRRPVTEWPEFTLKLNPLGITRELSASETWAGGQTVVGGASALNSGQGDSRGRYIASLAEIAYELLGGALSPLGHATGAAIRYTPLATLTEEGNEVVKRAISPANTFANAAAFQAELDAAERTRIDLGETKYETRVPSTAPALARPAPPPVTPAAPPPAVRRKRIPVGFIGGVATVATLATLLFLFLRDAPPLPSEKPKTTPGTTPATATPVRVVKTNPTPVPPKATPAPTYDEYVRAAVASAQVLENDGNWPRAIAGWLRVIKQFPETDSGKVRLEMLLAKIKKRAEAQTLSDEEFQGLLPGVQEAATLGLMAAQTLLGEMLRDRSPVESFNWFSAAAAQGSADALNQLGLMLSNGKGTAPDLQKALACFQEAADMGDAAGQLSLGECYLYGKGVEKDGEKAIELLTEAAKSNLQAMNLLGMCYHRGMGTGKNFTEAHSLFMRAADENFGPAIANLGVLYNNGDGVERDPVRAVEYFQRGAQLNDPASMYFLGLCYESGNGMPRPNVLEAQKYFKKAAEAGHEEAKALCDKRKIKYEAPAKR